jgi:hypothetical protein
VWLIQIFAYSDELHCHNKETFWSNVKFGEITDETLARILIAVFDGGNISLGWQKIMRNRKPVLEVAIASIPA